MFILIFYAHLKRKIESPRCFSKDDTERDLEELDNGIEINVKILKRVRKRYKGTNFVMISKIHSLQTRPGSPNVEVIVREFDLGEVWDSCKIEEDDGAQEQKKIKQIEKESRLLERNTRKAKLQIQAIRNKEVEDIVTSEEEPDEDDVRAKEKEEYEEEPKKIWEVTLRESDTESDEDSDDYSEEEQEIN